MSALAAQGKANTAIADAINKVQNDNVSLANTIGVKNAELQYKTQMLNNNEKKQLYDNTVLTDENYDNAMRRQMQLLLHSFRMHILIELIQQI